MLNGIKNFLEFVDNNWTLILVIVSLIVSIARKVIKFMRESDEDKLNAAKAQIKEVILTLVTDAEWEYQEWKKAGAIKRAEVIKNIFDAYPILSKFVNQEDLIAFIDAEIETALKEMREIFDNNENNQ